MMTRSAVLTAALFCPVLLWACSSSPDPEIQGERAQRNLQAEFDRLDADGSGDVSAIELTEARNAQFDALDADGSGFLNREELMAMRRSQPRAEREPDAGARPPQGQRAGGRRRGRSTDPRATMDSNGDGVISRDEFVGRGQRFLAETDFDGDGSVTAEELEKGLIRARAEVRNRR